MKDEGENGMRDANCPFVRAPEERGLKYASSKTWK